MVCVRCIARMEGAAVAPVLKGITIIVRAAKKRTGGALSHLQWTGICIGLNTRYMKLILVVSAIDAAGEINA